MYLEIRSTERPCTSVISIMEKALENFRVKRRVSRVLTFPSSPALHTGPGTYFTQGLNSLSLLVLAPCTDKFPLKSQIRGGKRTNTVREIARTINGTPTFIFFPSFCLSTFLEKTLRRLFLRYLTRV